MTMKRLLEMAKDKLGTVGAVQRALIKEGCEVTTEGIRKAIEDGSGEKTRRMYSALNRILHNGDWTKTGKIIDKE